MNSSIFIQSSHRPRRYLVVKLKFGNELHNSFKRASKRRLGIQLEAVNIHHHQVTGISLDHMQKLMTIATADMSSID